MIAHHATRQLCLLVLILMASCDGGARTSGADTLDAVGRELPGDDATPLIGDAAPPDVPDTVSPTDTPDMAPDTTPDLPGDLGPTEIAADSSEDLSPDVTDPWPIPDLDEEPAPTCQAAIDDPWYYQFLDNLCDEKVWPSDTDRDLACPIADAGPGVTLADGTLVTYVPSSAPVEWDPAALDGLLPPGMRMAVILVRRVDGVPHYRYLSGGDPDLPQQPWSTTKFLAIANAASRLRIASSYAVGLTADAGGYRLGDLVTSVHAYDDDPFSSNGLGRWFHDIGGRERANALIHSLWLGRPAVETFGGNYGAASPPIPYAFSEVGGASLVIDPDLSSGPANNLSLATLVEALKRLVLHREEADQRLPGIQWADLRVLLFGAEGSTKYGPWGGMSADTAIYLQAGHDMDYIEARSQGRWRIFSKLGLGTQGQFIHVGYACWPALDANGAPIEGLGREFVIAAHLASGGADLDERDRILARAYRRVILRIVDGRL